MKKLAIRHKERGTFCQVEDLNDGQGDVPGIALWDEDQLESSLSAGSVYCEPENFEIVAVEYTEPTVISVVQSLDEALNEGLDDEEHDTEDDEE